jgi:hypothetical protein
VSSMVFGFSALCIAFGTARLTRRSRAGPCFQRASTRDRPCQPRQTPRANHDRGPVPLALLQFPAHVAAEHVSGVSGRAVADRPASLPGAGGPTETGVCSANGRDAWRIGVVLRLAEDTNINGHPVPPRYGGGPFEAVNRFLEEVKKAVRSIVGASGSQLFEDRSQHLLLPNSSFPLRPSVQKLGGFCQSRRTQFERSHPMQKRSSNRRKQR